MAGDDKDLKKWGTIFLGTQRESSVDELDAMQAAVRQEQWNRRTAENYMARVREKATERAKAILGEAYTERQNILDEGHQLAQRIQQQAQQELEKAADICAQAESERQKADATLHDAEHLREAARQQGYNAGIEQASAELTQFRNAMGASVAGVLGEIHRQCSAIFEGWRDELTELMRVCVAKGTGIVIGEEHQRILHTLLIEAVRQLDDRRVITLRVHPDDEPAIADIVAAARESIPDIGQWVVMGDANMQPGGIIAEGRSGTVDSRLELHQQLVQDILRNLSLPPSQADANATAAVENVLHAEQARIVDVAGSAPAAADAPATTAEPSTPAALTDDAAADATAVPADADDLPPLSDAGLPDDMPTALHPETNLQPDMTPPLPEHDAPQPDVTGLPPAPDLPAFSAPDTDIDFDAMQAEAAALLSRQGSPDPAPGISVEELLQSQTLQSEGDIMQAQRLLDAQGTAGADPFAEPTRDELEEELLPLPDTDPMPQNASGADDALIRGGFVDIDQQGGA